jgi:hypothetical protein
LLSNLNAPEAYEKKKDFHSFSRSNNGRRNKGINLEERIQFPFRFTLAAENIETSGKYFASLFVRSRLQILTRTPAIQIEILRGFHQSLRENTGTNALS